MFAISEMHVTKNNLVSSLFLSAVLVFLTLLTFAIANVDLQRLYWPVYHTVSLIYQSLLHNFEPVQHHNPVLAHPQAEHVSMFLC